MKIGRDASNGRFVPVETAKKFPKTHVVERIDPAPDRGGDKDKPKGKK